MSAEDILEQINGIVDDDSMIAADKVYEIKDIIDSEAKDLPYIPPLTDEKTDALLVWAHLAAGGSPDDVVMR